MFCFTDVHGATSSHSVHYQLTMCHLCRTAEVAEEIWAATFKYLADNKVLFEGMLLKPSMVTPGADSGKKV